MKTKHHRELLGEGLDFAPVRLLGGFICADFYIGCAGCVWCLNRRHTGLHRLLNRNIHLDIADCGITVEDLKGLSGEGVLSLKTSARQKGLAVWDYFGCLLRKKLKIQFFKLDIAISTVGRGQNKACRFLNPEVLERWQRSGFFPVEAAREMSRKIALDSGQL